MAQSYGNSQGLFGILKQHESRSGYMSETGWGITIDACVIVSNLALFVASAASASIAPFACSGRFSQRENGRGFANAILPLSRPTYQTQASLCRATIGRLRKTKPHICASIGQPRKSGHSSSMITMR